MKSAILILAATAAMVAGVAHAGDYGAPPYASGAYGYAGYDGGDCGGFTLAGAHAGVTVLGVSVGAGGAARIGGGGCHGYGGGAAYAPQPAYQGYQGPAYPAQGGYYNQPAYAAPVAYPTPAYAQPGYGYAPPPCGCAQPYGYAQPY